MNNLIELHFNAPFTFNASVKHDSRPPGNHAELTNDVSRVPLSELIVQITQNRGILQRMHNRTNNERFQISFLSPRSTMHNA
jgi:hypothetical protein